MNELTIGVGGMSCQGCVKSVTSALLALPGVEKVHVSLEAGEARIVYDPARVGEEAFRAAIEGAGFDVV